MATIVCFTSIPWTKSSKCTPFHKHLSTRLVSTKLSSANFNKIVTNTSSSNNNSKISTKPEIARKCKEEFHPNVWDGNFISSSPSYMKPDELTGKRMEELKNEIKDILSSDNIDAYDRINFIDKIQQLGVAYHFESEIGETLQHLYDNATHENGNLYNVSFRFRIFRQAGFYVSPGVFEKFKVRNGEFGEELKTDWEGLLSLYEAAYLSIKGEDILDEALAFSKKHLVSLVNYLPSAVALQIQRALDLPLRKRIIRVHARYYISVYEQDEFKNCKLMEFAKLDYNLLQKLHRTEIREISKWWKDKDIVSKLPFVMRDRLVEGYAMMVAIFFEPKYSTGRLYMSKLFGLLTVLDDTFDSYGTLEELQPLTDAILRWNLEDMDDYDLPEYVKIIVVEVLDLFTEIEGEMSSRGQAYSISYFKSTMQHYVKCSMDEAKMFHSKTVPPLQDWLQNAVVTSGAAVLIIGSILDTWDLATKEALDWSVSNPKIINSCTRIGRLGGDIHTFKSEREIGNASSIKCYMKENNVHEEEALESIKRMIEEDWKEMNQECLKPTLVPMNLLTIVFNVGRVAVEFYLYGDGYTHSKGYTKEVIDSLLVNPVPSSTI